MREFLPNFLHFQENLCWRGGPGGPPAYTRGSAVTLQLCVPCIQARVCPRAGGAALSLRRPKHNIMEA